MERRRAVAIAAATATTTLAAVAAMAANFGLLGFGQAASSPVGNLEAGRVAQVIEPPPASPSAPGAGPNVTVRYEDVYLPAPTAAVPTAAVPTAPAAATAATQATPAVQPTGEPSTLPAHSGPVAAGDGAPPAEDYQAEDEPSDDRYEDEDRDYEEDD